LLIEEAGGRVSDYQNRSLDIFNPPILASNGLIHEQMMRVLAL
jgi:fructose-1,6-bisphosphatase/inositol monophosphatase family enzyme